ncbi:MAG TPA: hypothetical protein PK874_04655 [Desulfobacteraceae bacterium]|nr:hypothetical protein [Desulfobacteraceae bacterium]HPJ67634.1 hypothetical protein [Desulfobacteraceae bacterium]HPQ29434.1 hypothetical protein [Desulfobacteraceae bacterium]
MSRIYIPTSNAEQWSQFLADPKHWRQGYSARTLAFSWQEADGFPSEVQAILSSQFPAIELLLAIPEHKVPLPGGLRPSQNDIWILARSQGQLVSIAVEGKVSEPFGPTVQEWQIGSSSGKSDRLSFLLRVLDISSVPESTRYQLLHRTASAIIEAQRFNATSAVMLVHSFSQSNEWFQDFVSFVSLMDGIAIENGIISVGNRSGIALYLAWVHGNEDYLNK